MENLSKLLERFSKILNRDSATKEIIIKTIRDKTSVTLPLESINLKEGVLEVNSSPAVKNEINLKEESIKIQLKELHNIKISRILYK